MHRLTFAAMTFLVLSIVCQAQPNTPVTFKAHKGPVRQVAFSPDGKLLLTALNGKHSLKLWNPTTQKLLRTLPGTGSSIITANFTPDGKQVFAASWDRRVRIWDVGTGKLQRTIFAAGIPHGAAFSPIHARLALGLLGRRTIQIVDVTTGATVKTLKVPMKKPPPGANSYSQVRFSDDGKWLVAVCGGRGWPKFIGDDSVMAIWDTRTWSMRARFTADRHIINILAISKDGKVIAGACFRSKTVKLWKTPNPEPKKAVVPGKIMKWIKDLDHDRFAVRERAQQRLRDLGPLAAEGLFQATTSESLEVQLRASSLLAALEVQPAQVLQRGPSDVHAMALSPDGKMLVWGSRSKQLYYSRLQQRQKPLAVPAPGGAWSLAFRLDGKQLAAGNADGTVTLMPVSVLK